MMLVPGYRGDCDNEEMLTASRQQLQPDTSSGEREIVGEVNNGCTFDRIRVVVFKGALQRRKVWCNGPTAALIGPPK